MFSGLEMEKLIDTVDTLCKASRTHVVDPYGELIDLFPETLDTNQWFFSPELISLHGTDEWAKLSEAEQKRLSFFECINFFSLTLHGEKMQLDGLAQRLYSRETSEVTPYLHHFLDEENNHMMYFGRFCQQYAGKIYAPAHPQKMTVDREYAPGEADFLFFMKLMMFEELGDAYNVRIARDARIPSIVRQINLLHHKDEARHLAFGRQVVKDIFAKNAPSWPAETLAHVRDYLRHYLVSSWGEFYNPRVYKDAGLAGDAFDLRDAAFEHSAGRARRRELSGPMLHFLVNAGMFPEEPDVG
jgi:hypothetical protein